MKMKINKKPSRHKLALLSWLAIYPLITGIFLVFNQPLMQLALPVRTFVLTIVLVGLMSYIIMPYLTKVFNKWLLG
jgi:antibiotic biosynthesis monooxygenase (ABM) superfamily enzyme